jgi:hypothetical protein
MIRGFNLCAFHSRPWNGMQRVRTSGMMIMSALAQTLENTTPQPKMDTRVTQLHRPAGKFLAQNERDSVKNDIKRYLADNETRQHRHIIFHLHFDTCFNRHASHCPRSLHCTPCSSTWSSMPPTELTKVQRHNMLAAWRVVCRSWLL